MFAFLFALVLLVCIVLALVVVRARADVARLVERLDRTDPQALASLDIDSFGALDGIASRVYRMRSELERRIAAAEWQQTMLQHIIRSEEHTSELQSRL